MRGLSLGFGLNKKLIGTGDAIPENAILDPDTGFTILDPDTGDAIIDPDA